MKNYHIDKPYSDDPNTIVIYNDDENPIIKTIQCNVFDSIRPGEGVKMWCVDVEIKSETPEIMERFHAVPETYLTHRIGYESLINQKNMENIILFFRVIQEVDPLPLTAFSEIGQLINYDLSQFLNHGLIEQMVENGNHEKALQLALDADAKGDVEVMPMLANLYQEIEDEDNYYNVLAHYRKTHHEFAHVNEMLHENLLSEPISKDEDDRIHRLELKLRYALNAGMMDEPSNYFDELCGNTGIKPRILNVKGDPDTLIHIAQEQRQLKKELEELRNDKAKMEAGRAAEARSVKKDDKKSGDEDLGTQKERGRFFKH